MKLKKLILSFAASSILVMPAIAQDSFLEKLRDGNLLRGEVRRPKATQIDIPGPVPNLNDNACSKNPRLNNAAQRREVEKNVTNGVHTFLDTAPVQKVSGIQAVRWSGSKLSAELGSKAKFEEFSGPVVQVIEKTIYEGKPGSALIAHTLTLGLFFALSPINSAQQAFGCIDRRILRQEVQVEESLPTGRFSWEDAPTVHVLRVEAFGESHEYNFSSDPRLQRSIFEIDLLPQIMRSDVSQPTAIKVTCVSCNATDAFLAATGWSIEDSKETVSDFSGIKNAELARQQFEQEAEQQRIREAQAVEAFKQRLIGRWTTEEVCLSSKYGDIGSTYKMDGDGKMLLTIGTLDGGRFMKFNESIVTDIKPVNATEQIYAVSHRIRRMSYGSYVTRNIRMKLRDEEMQILEMSDNNNAVVRSGVQVSTGHALPSIINCDHPKVVARRTRLEREEQDRVRRIQLAEQEKRRQLEQEEAEQKRKRDEKDKLYKL